MNSINNENNRFKITLTVTMSVYVEAFKIENTDVNITEHVEVMEFEQNEVSIDRPRINVVKKKLTVNEQDLVRSKNKISNQ